MRTLKRYRVKFYGGLVKDISGFDRKDARGIAFRMAKRLKLDGFYYVRELRDADPTLAELRGWK